jgi:hypothetical protein
MVILHDQPFPAQVGRHDLMARWATFLTTPPAQVIPAPGSGLFGPLRRPHAPTGRPDGFRLSTSSALRGFADFRVAFTWQGVVPRHLQ